MASSQSAKSFPDFFVHVLRCQFETWYIHLVGSATYRVRVWSQSDLTDLLYSKTRVKVIFLHLWPQQLFRAFTFSTHTNIASVLNCTDFRHGWAIFGPVGGHKHSERGSQQSLPPPESFLSFFSTYFEIWTWNLVYTSGRWHNTSSLSFIIIRSLPLESFSDIFLNILGINSKVVLYTQ